MFFSWTFLLLEFLVVSSEFLLQLSFLVLSSAVSTALGVGSLVSASCESLFPSSAPLLMLWVEISGDSCFSSFSSSPLSCSSLDSDCVTAWRAASSRCLIDAITASKRRCSAKRFLVLFALASSWEGSGTGSVAITSVLADDALCGPLSSISCFVSSLSSLLFAMSVTTLFSSTSFAFPGLSIVSVPSFLSSSVACPVSSATGFLPLALFHLPKLELTSPLIASFPFRNRSTWLTCLVCAATTAL